MLDHSLDLTLHPGSNVHDAAMELIALGLRTGLTCPAPATLDQRITLWRAFHCMPNLRSRLAAPLVAQTRQNARRAADRPPAPKSAHRVPRDVLERLLTS